MFDLVSIIKVAGYLGLFGIIFAESGLFFGFFLPGDSLLFTAGFLASQGVFNIWLLVLVLFFAAVLGDNVGYSFGRKVGPKIFTREDSLFFQKNHIERARLFFENHGKKAIVLARFFPVIRTFTPILAGVGGMHYQVFLFFNLVGAFLWAGLITLSGYYLGSLVPNADRYILPIVAVIVIVSSLPAVIQILKNPKSRARIRSFFQKRKTS